MLAAVERSCSNRSATSYAACRPSRVEAAKPGVSRSPSCSAVRVTKWFRAGSVAGFSRKGVLVCATSGKVILEVKNLHAKIASTDQMILNGVNLTVREGEVHAIMGKNGSGKSTLSKVLVGHPAYEVTEGSVTYKDKDLLEMEPEERSREGVFLSFQSPIELPGVSNTDFLRMSCNARRKLLGKPELDPLEFYGHLMPKLEALKMDPSFLSRNVNEGFSGGEKKRNEILQLAVLEADLMILDEIDSGLDVDALRDVAASVNGLRHGENALLMITHYQKLLEYIKPDTVHIVKGGVIVKTGGFELANEIEQGGFAAVSS